MSDEQMTLGTWPLDLVKVECEKCGRKGQMHTDRLIGKYGADMDMFSARLKITEAGCQRADRAQPCTAILPDAFLVQAIIETNEEKVLKKELIPEARRWREESGRG